MRTIQPKATMTNLHVVGETVKHGEPYPRAETDPLHMSPWKLKPENTDITAYQ